MTRSETRGKTMGKMEVREKNGKNMENMKGRFGRVFVACESGWKGFG